MRTSLWVIFVLALPLTAHAEMPQSFRQAFDLAWSRQGASHALPEQRLAAAARQVAAGAWTPAPAAIEIGGRSDRFSQNRGAAELELGLAIPLWLPGERAAGRAQAGIEAGLLEDRLAVLRWQLAGEIRAAWWAWQLAHEDVLLADGELAAVQRLHDDVARRVKAGDLARADHYQAAAALAAAQAGQVDAGFRLAKAAAGLQALSGLVPELPPRSLSGLVGEPLPAPQGEDWLEAHPALRLHLTQAELARQTQSLARTRSRANPEVMLATRRERGARDESGEQSWSIGLRIPLSSGSQHAAVIADANALLIGAELALARERERLLLAARLSQQQWQAAEQRRLASEARARLSRDSLGFFAKSFQIGETDLPTRLRVEQEAFAAERALQRARVEQAAALSDYRQALGLLPE